VAQQRGAMALEQMPNEVALCMVRAHLPNSTVEPAFSVRFGGWVGWVRPQGGLTLAMGRGMGQTPRGLTLAGEPLR
jgi:hypothetical protein